MFAPTRNANRHEFSLIRPSRWFRFHKCLTTHILLAILSVGFSALAEPNLTIPSGAVSKEAVTLSETVVVLAMTCGVVQ